MKKLLQLSAFVFLAGMLSSCGREYAGSDLSEKQHPKISQARLLVQQQDLEGAEQLLQEALRDNPELALAHLQLGMIYQTREVPVDALYHFKRYIAARPDGEKAQILQQVIEDERRRLASQVDMERQSPESAAAELVTLRRQLSDAEQQIAEMEVNLQQSRMSSTSSSGGPPPEWAEERLRLLKEIQRLKMSDSGSPTDRTTPTNPVSPITGGRTYTVKRGDTLSSIAQQTYGKASEWSKIYEANRELIPNKNVLRPQTVLILP